MTPKVSEERLDWLLADLDPGPFISTPEVQARLSQLTLDMRNSDQRGAAERDLAQGAAKRRSRRITWTVIGLLALAIGTFGAIPAAAAVQQWLARTGTFGSNFSHTAGDATSGAEADKSEWIQIDATDSDGVLAGLYPAQLLLPAGVTKAQVISLELHLDSVGVASGGGGPAVQQVTTIQASFENIVACTWNQQWILASAARDDSLKQTAIHNLAATMQMHAMVSSWGSDPGTQAFVKQELSRIESGDPTEPAQFVQFHCPDHADDAIYKGMRG